MAANQHRRFLILAGLVSGLAVALGGIFWTPYEDPGTPGPPHNHFFALSMTCLDVMIPFLWGAYRANRNSQNGVWREIVSLYFLRANATLTLMLFIFTYTGLSYKLFWALQFVQWAGFAAVFAASNFVSQSVGTRETTAGIAAIRKRTVLDELENLRHRFPPAAGSARDRIVSAADKLSEELRYFPNQEIPVGMGNPFGRILKWKSEAEAFLRVTSGAAAEGAAGSQLDVLVVEAGEIARSLANYKR